MKNTFISQKTFHRLKGKIDDQHVVVVEGGGRRLGLRKSRKLPQIIETLIRLGAWILGLRSGRGAHNKDSSSFPICNVQNEVVRVW